MTRTIVKGKEDHDRLRCHDAQSHCGHETNLTQYSDLAGTGSNCQRILVDTAAPRDSLRDDDPGQCFGHEYHCKGECTTDYDVYIEDPSPSHVRVVCDPLPHRRAQTGAHVGAHHKQGHWLASIVSVAPQVRNRAGNVAERCRASCAAEELEDDEHGQVVGERGPDVENGVDENGTDIDPFSAANVCQRPQEGRSHRIAYDEHRLAQRNDLGAGWEFFLDQEFGGDIGCGGQGHEGLQQAVYCHNRPFLPEGPVDWMSIVVRANKAQDLKRRAVSATLAYGRW